MKKLLKNIVKILIIILFILILFILANSIIHTIKSKNEYKKLKDLGYINKYSAGDYNLNIYRVGNKNSKYKLIALSGLGVNNYSIEMSFVNEKLKENYEIIYIDRAGYGYSDDTSIKQTTEQIVSDYRTALKNAGIDGPYILLPHSLGGVYATYWESMHPEEIQGVIFIDTSELSLNAWNTEEYKVEIFNYLELYACNFGLQRLVLHHYYYPMPSYYSETEQKLSDYLNIHSASTKASFSEYKEIVNNTNFVYKNIVSNDIPKIYISSSNGFREIDDLKEYIKWVNERKKEIGLKTTSIPDDKNLKEAIQIHIDWENDRIKPYINLLGNTKIVYLPGDHMIFEQKPDELAQIIKEFIDSLD